MMAHSCCSEQNCVHKIALGRSSHKSESDGSTYYLTVSFVNERESIVQNCLTKS